MDKEYVMLREELLKNLDRENNNFFLMLTILGLGNTVGYIFENVLFLVLVLYITIFIQLKIIECRRVVDYISTYMIIFLESKSESYHWESRLRKFKSLGIDAEDINSKVKKFFTSIGYKMKRSIIALLSCFIFVRILYNLIIENLGFLSEIILLLLAAIGLILNVIYSVIICTDKSVEIDDIKNNVFISR